MASKKEEKHNNGFANLLKTASDKKQLPNNPGNPSLNVMISNFEKVAEQIDGIIPTSAPKS